MAFNIIKNNLETIDLIFEVEKTRELYKRYFKFQRKKEFKKIPSVTLLSISALLALIGYFVKIDLLWIIGLISASLVSIFLFYYFIRFQIAYTNYSVKLKNSYKYLDKNFQFLFDSENIVYKSKNMTSEIKWNLITDYDVNGKDLYLFMENRELFDIISEQIIGKYQFDIFKEILTKNVTNDR